MRKILKFYRQLYTKITISLLKIANPKQRVSFGDGVRFVGFPDVRAKEGSEIIIGNNLVAISTSVSNAYGLSHRVIIRTLAPSAMIKIGNNVGMSGNAIVARIGIEIGDNVQLGANAKVVDNDFHPIDSTQRYKNDDTKIVTAKVVIGSDVWIGADSVILKGVTIGPRSVVGARSVVTKSFPSDVLICGNPARIVREIK